MKTSIFILLLAIHSALFSQKNENRILHISGSDTITLDFNGFTGNLDSLIEETLKSFYNIVEENESKRIEFSFDSLFTKEFDIRMDKNVSSSPGDTIKFKIGNMDIVIIDDKENTGDKEEKKERKIIIDKEIIVGDEKENDKNKKYKSVKINKEEKPLAYWAGLSYGINGMLNNQGNFTTKNDADFLQFDYAKSYEIQLNFLEKRFPIHKHYLGVTTGLGLKWNRFTLENNSIQLNYNDSLLFSSPSPSEYKRSTLRSAYLQVPLLIELCSNKNPDKAWHLSLGVMGGLRIGSSWRTKVGNDVTNIKGDFNFRPFTASALAILGYDDVSLYLNYGLSNLFDKNAAPQTRSVSAGIMLNF